MESNPWVTRGVKPVYDNPWIRVDEHDVLNPNGGKGIYGVVTAKKVGIGILPIFADGTTVLVGQWRYPIGKYTWEMPEGGGEPAVAPLESARRELLEETGLSAAHWLELVHLDTSNALMNEHAVCFVAWGLSQGRADPDETEKIALKTVHFREALAMVLDGRMQDAMSVATILKIAVLAARGELPAELARAIA